MGDWGNGMPIFVILYICADVPLFELHMLHQT